MLRKRDDESPQEGKYDQSRRTDNLNCEYGSCQKSNSSEERWNAHLTVAEDALARKDPIEMRYDLVGSGQMVSVA